MRFIDRDLVLVMIDFYSPIQSLPFLSLNQKIEPWPVNTIRAETVSVFHSCFDSDHNMNSVKIHWKNLWMKE